MRSCQYKRYEVPFPRHATEAHVRGVEEGDDHLQSGDHKGVRESSVTLALITLSVVQLSFGLEPIH